MPDQEPPSAAPQAAPAGQFPAGDGAAAKAGESGLIEPHLALALELSGIAIWRLDLASGRVHLNPRAATMLGVAATDASLSPAQMREYLHPDDAARVFAVAPDSHAADAPQQDELRYRSADGSWRWALVRRVVHRDAAGSRLAVLGVALDVTERRQADLALRTAAERAALAARGAGVGTWELDVDNGEAQWDEQMWLLRGLAPQPRAMTAAERLAIVHPDDRAAMAAALSHAMQGNKPLHHEFRVIWPDGRVHWLASRSTETHETLAGHRRRIGVNWDITDSRTAEAVRHERELALRESQAKSRFLSRMSHELRTPLNAVLGFSQLLLADETGQDTASAQRRRRLDLVRGAGQHLLTLVDDVLELSGLQGGELRITVQAVALAPLLHEAMAMLEPLRASRGVALRLGTIGGTVMADPTRLRQVLINLLSSAIKLNLPEDDMRVETQPEGQNLRLRVTVRGPGLTSQQLTQLYEPFNRLGGEPQGADGSGVEMAIVKALVERMGGRVEARNQAGAGSVFEIVLASANGAAAAAPRLDAPSSAVNPGAATEARAPHPLQRLLYIEDNPVNARIIKDLLARRDDIAVHLAADGASGVAQAGLLRPKLILLDMQLPDFDGFEVLRRLRAQPASAAIPCIALSANAMPDDIARALDAGMSEYWTKPLDFGAFQASIDRLFGPPP